MAELASLLSFSMFAQVPRGVAFARLLGFPPADEEIAWEAWPDFLLWFRAERDSDLAAPAAADGLRRAAAALEAATTPPLAAELRRRAAIRAAGAIDLDRLESLNSFTLDELGRLVARVLCDKQREDPAGVTPLPHYLRLFALRKVTAGLVHNRTALFAS